MDFEMKVNMDNAAFNDEYAADQLELARILKEAARKVENGARDGVVMDINGNKVGSWEISE